MATKIQEPELLDTYRSHWVTVGYHGMEKEEVYPRFLTEWRGERVVIAMACDRYADSNYRVGAWRVVASEANYVTIPPSAVTTGPAPAYVTGLDPLKFERGSSVTDLARRRLAEACKPLALAWLESESYRVSERLAYVHAIKREFSDMRGSDSHRVRDKIRLVADKLGHANTRALVALCDAWDDFVRVLDGI